MRAAVISLTMYFTTSVSFDHTYDTTNKIYLCMILDGL